MADPDRLHDHLVDAVHKCIRLDGADAVIIGGGPLAAAADSIQKAMCVPVIAPIPTACRALARHAEGRRAR